MQNLLLMEKVIGLCKRRGFIFQDSEIYGGLANTWDFGPLGVELKNSIKKLWWERFVERRDDVFGIDTALIMNPKVWEASGHLENFSDPLVECKKCHQRFRGEQISGADALPKERILERKKLGHAADFRIDPNAVCPNCGAADFAEPQSFNLLFRTSIGPIDDYSLVVRFWDKSTSEEEKEAIKRMMDKSRAYLRPETAQGMFVNFKNILDTMRPRLPFGIAQIGKAFRNEITPGNFVFRTREFEMMEIEYFVREREWKEYFEYWRGEMHSWIREVGIDGDKVYEEEIPDGERAHYSKRTIDFEYDFPFGRKELYGLAYRTDFDLKNHEKASGQSLKYRDPDTGEEFLPHVIEPTWGVERTVLAMLLSSYAEDGDRVILKLKPRFAPYKAAVFPLLANKPELVNLAREIYNDLRKKFAVAWDDRGNIGKRYYAQDEIGTPYCITVDFESLEKKDVTVRDRDSAKQERVTIPELASYLSSKLF